MVELIVIEVLWNALEIVTIRNADMHFVTSMVQINLNLALLIIVAFSPSLAIFRNNASLKLNNLLVTKLITVHYGNFAWITKSQNFLHHF